MATAITVKTKSAALQTLFSKIQHVYYNASAIASGTSTVSDCTELPVLEDGVTFNTGEAEVTEVNLIDGSIWTSKADKGDSDISFQVASLNEAINNLFLTKGKTYSGVTLDGGTAFGGAGYALDVKKATGSLVMTDDTGNTMIILPNVEMYGSLTVADGDNPAYFDVSVTPKANTDGDAIILLTK